MRRGVGSFVSSAFSLMADDSASRPGFLPAGMRRAVKAESNEYPISGIRGAPRPAVNAQNGKRRSKSSKNTVENESISKSGRVKNYAV
jgi:hypothetical protein